MAERKKGFLGLKSETKEDLRSISQELKDQLNTTDKINEMTENEMKVEYEKDYVLIYKKKSE